MYPVPSSFHDLITADGAVTRVRIYFVDDSIDYTDDTDVITNGTLLAMPGDTDSNGRIQQNGFAINEFFNSGTNLEIGKTVSSQIDMTIFNDDGDLNNFQFGRCKIYLDVYDDDEEDWVTCPLGVYNFDIPKRRKVQLIGVGGYDNMQLLNSIADTWWNGLDWESGITVLGIIQSMGATLGLHLASDVSTSIVNGSVSFTSPPFPSVEMTFREVLEYVCEATCTIARFNRDGELEFRYFAAAEISNQTVTIPADGVNSQCVSIDIAEYTVNAIDSLVVKTTNTDVGVSVGSGSNQYVIINNPLLAGADEAEITAKATPIYNRLAALSSFKPIQMRIRADCSIESGDIVNVTYDNETYYLPIFQQKLSWKGGYVTSDIISSGDVIRPAASAPTRKEFRTASQLHEFEVTVEQLRSMIQDVSGNYSLIEQTVNAISQTVANQYVTIQNILDPTGEIWTAITNNASNLSSIENSLNNEIAERRSYIRFIPSEPAIVMGVDEDTEIKLKLVNNVIYFFNGADDSTDLSLAYAYFNSNEAFADRFVASRSVQFGNNDVKHWLWHRLSSGDLVLDLVEETT